MGICDAVDGAVLPAIVVGVARGNSLATIVLLLLLLVFADLTADAVLWIVEGQLMWLLLCVGTEEARNCCCCC